jgi:hypothetical protein
MKKYKSSRRIRSGIPARQRLSRYGPGKSSGQASEPEGGLGKRQRAVDDLGDDERLAEEYKGEGYYGADDADDADDNLATEMDPPLPYCTDPRRAGTSGVWSRAVRQ